MIYRVLTAWSWYPSVIFGCIGLVAAYLAMARLRPSPRFVWFFLGVLTILLALISPLDPLSDDYLFSAHMVQHLLLILIAAPLLLIGIPEAWFSRLLDQPLPARIERQLGRPLVAWLLGIGTLWLWHLPVLYEATLADEGVHIFEHLTFLVTGVIFWWPLIVPPAHRRLNAFYSLVYLFTGGLANSLLGIILTFAPNLIYRGYLHPEDELGILPLLRETWGLSPMADQQLGGLLMWVGGSLILLLAMMAILVRWYAAPAEDADTENPAAFPAPPEGRRLS